MSGLKDIWFVWAAWLLVAGPGEAAWQVRMSPDTTAAAAGKQQFMKEPKNQVAVVGSTVVLPCKVMNLLGHVQWTMNGFGLGLDRKIHWNERYTMIGEDDEGEYSLRIHPVKLDDDGEYQCQVSAKNDTEGMRSRKATLTVYMPPDPPQVRPPVLINTAGMAVTLTCESRGGRPAAEVEWRDDSTGKVITQGVTLTSDDMPDKKRYNVRSTLSFTPKRTHDNSSLTCITKNPALHEPSYRTIPLKILYPPDVTLIVSPPVLMEGNDVTFVCNADANPAVASYKWYVNNARLLNETKRSLTIRDLTSEFHRSAVLCEVSNKVGTSKKSQRVCVQYGPRFKTLPQNVKGDEGMEVLLVCNVDSNPSPTITWYRETDMEVQGTGAELRVVVSGSTAGVYRCVASVRGFPDLTGHMRVLLKGPPLIVSSSDQQGRMGDTVTLECSTVSIPSPIKVVWTYNGQEIDFSDPRYDVVEDEQNGNVRNYLVIHDADEEDFGSYNCSVVNEYGVARMLIRLKQEKTLPVYALVWGSLGIIVVALTITGIIVCTRRRAIIQALAGPHPYSHAHAHVHAISPQHGRFDAYCYCPAYTYV